ncbi:hypothetical protein P7K49_009300 [Saguinus oedipus]|uniref:Uncharacterized protein n=1 Tax=Saguinus oedipus TaxID=9490 RepID=A0ABQ9VKY4_SAGOE|nr:hypothetical protein P7K49_009300 [Saguinus oedipus]
MAGQSAGPVPTLAIRSRHLSILAKALEVVLSQQGRASALESQGQHRVSLPFLPPLPPLPWPRPDTEPTTRWGQQGFQGSLVVYWYSCCRWLRFVRELGQQEGSVLCSQASQPERRSWSLLIGCCPCKPHWPLSLLLCPQEMAAEKAKAAAGEAKVKKQLVAREQEITAVQARMQASYREHVKEVQQLQGKIRTLQEQLENGPNTQLARLQQENSILRDALNQATSQVESK